MNKIYSELSQINVNEKTEKKNGLTYLSWAWAIDTLEKYCDEHDLDLDMGIDNESVETVMGTSMVHTYVTIDGKTKRQWLPVMDFRNNVISCPTATDINKAYMRCLTKNISRWGLGMYIYAGEDIPKDENGEKQKAEEPKIEYIKKKTWELLAKTFSKDEIIAMKKECEVTRNDMIPENYAQTKLKEHNDKVKEQLPEKVFY